MKTLTYLALGVAALAGGCASGGGSSGAPSPQTAPAPRPASSEPSPCGTVNGRPVHCVPTQRAAIDAAMAGASGGSMPYAEVFEALGMYPPPGAPRRPKDQSRSSPAQPTTGYVRIDMYYEPNKFGTIWRANYAGEEYSARMGAPIEWNIAPTPGDPKALNPFTQRPGNAGVSSAFQGYGFEYQGFGAWNEHVGFHGNLMAWSHGETTPAHALPKTGSAKFTGKLLGLYVSPTGQGSRAAADVALDADFSTRSLGLASTRTAINGNAAPDLDLRGTLTYSAGQNKFAGTLTNAGGTLTGPSKGQFYGPKAQELGGAFALKGNGAETFVGGYGAKR